PGPISPGPGPRAPVAGPGGRPWSRRRGLPNPVLLPAHGYAPPGARGCRGRAVAWRRTAASVAAGTCGGGGAVVALALYRKYRPRTLAEVIGQEHVTEPLVRALSTGRVNHAYLFSGPRGC